MDNEPKNPKARKPRVNMSYNPRGKPSSGFNSLDPLKLKDLTLPPPEEANKSDDDGPTFVSQNRQFNSYVAQIEDPRSFLNLLPDSLRNAVLTIPEELLNKDEDSLLSLLDTKYNYKPTAALEAMRNNFWMEHDRVVVTRKEIINQANIWLGVVSKEYFHKVVHEAPHLLSYMLCRPPEYESVMRGLLGLSTRKIRDVLNIPLQRPDGSYQDPKIIELILKAAAMVDLRAKGGYIQRSETKNLTLMKQENSYTNIFTAATNSKPKEVPTLATEIDERIAALEKEMQAIPGIQAAIEEQVNNAIVEANYTKIEDTSIE